jgi:hypothetical protein
MKETLKRTAKIMIPVMLFCCIVEPKAVMVITTFIGVMIVPTIAWIIYESNKKVQRESSFS